MDAIFANVGQAVHVAFLVMSQPAMQQAPLRKALIRAMETIKLEGYQLEWLEQLRGAPSENVNFGGLSGDEVRAQCVMIKQAVAHLPDPERWALQAKYGYVEYEDATPDSAMAQQMANALERANTSASVARDVLRSAREELDTAREDYLQARGRLSSPAADESVRCRYEAARDAVQDASKAAHEAEALARQIQIIVDRADGVTIAHGGLPAGAGEERRFAFSAERIEAIKGLSDWMHPMFPEVKAMAVDCMLGRMFAQHKKVSISVRDLAANFGGNHMTYQRASTRMKDHMRQLEERALERLALRLINDGVALPKESD
jgi:hypothetical protein